MTERRSSVGAGGPDATESGGRRYELTLVGDVPRQLAAAIGATRSQRREAETVLRFEGLDAEGLGQVITRLEELGLELREIHRRSAPGRRA